VNQELGRLLQQAVWERLEMLEKLASSADNKSLLSVARTELPRLTSGWRALLDAHTPDSRGRCPECSSRWRPRAALCSVWRAAHNLFPAEPISTGGGSAVAGPRPALAQMRSPRSLLPPTVPVGAGAAH
jgi:hypothetical protein